MDVPVTELRAHLSGWIERVRAGGEVVVTDHGLPVARLVPVTATSLLERLTQRGVIARPVAGQRPVASGRRKATATGPVSALVSEQRG